MDPCPLDHGGGLDAAAARFGTPREAWIDLSTGINPEPYPLPRLDASLWHRLPDRDLDRALRSAAALCYAAPDADRVVAAPGSQAVIQWLPRLLAPTRVAVISPTYNEHGASWAAAGHAVEEIDGRKVPAGTAVLVVTNPNNPDGRTLTPDALLALGCGRLLVVDEAFCDTEPTLSLAPFVDEGDTVVLRSFGKFFGLAGLRLGFAVASEPWAGRLRRALGPWAVGGPAARIGALALSDRAWIAATRKTLGTAAGRLRALFAAAGLDVVGGTDLFLLVEHREARSLFEHLASAAILVRRFPARPTWLRFGLPGSDTDWRRLEQALDAWRTSPAAMAQTG